MRADNFVLNSMIF